MQQYAFPGDASAPGRKPTAHYRCMLSGPLLATLTVLFLSSNRKAGNSRPLDSFHLSPQGGGSPWAFMSASAAQG